MSSICFEDIGVCVVAVAVVVIVVIVNVVVVVVGVGGFKVVITGSFVSKVRK